MEFSQSFAEREQFLPIAEWVEGGRTFPQMEEKVVSLRVQPRFPSVRGDIAAPR